jgi:2-amino-4-hydroxy-6-hydroxymethyldihydropteridine diphosphokinase
VSKLLDQDDKKNIVFLSLGTNLGKKEENLKNAKKHIATFATIIKQSSICKTEPFGIITQPLFLNQVIQIETDLKPQQLLKKLQQIEAKMGRVRTIKNGPRVMDIDILFYNNEVINTSELEVPHPRLDSREALMQLVREIRE